MAEDELIQGTTTAGIASIFPAAPSSGNCGLLDFGSALFAMLGAETAQELQGTASGTSPAIPSGIPTRALRSDAPLQGTAPEHPAEKKRPDFGQDLVPVAVGFPLPVPIPQQIQATSAEPGAASSGQSALEPLGGAEASTTQPASTPVTPTTPSAALPSPADPTPVAFRPLVSEEHRPPAQLQADSTAPGAATSSAPTLQPLGTRNSAITEPSPAPITGATPSAAFRDLSLIAFQPLGPGGHHWPEADDQLHTKLDQLSQAHAAQNDQTAQTLALRSQPEKTAESLKVVVAQPAVPDSCAPAKNDPDVYADAASVAPAGQQAAASPAIQLGFPLKQTPDQVLPSASINLPVMPASLHSKSAFEQAAGKNSVESPTTGKPQQSASPSPVDRHNGKERTDRTTDAAEPKPDTASGDAVKALNQSGAADTPPGKAQSEPGGAGVLTPVVPRTDAATQTDASDASPKLDASSQAPVDNRATNQAALPTQQSAGLFHSVQLVEKVAQSELYLGIRTGEFGNIEIRTSFDHQQVRAEISSERGDLGRTLSTELPGLEQRMREQDVPLSAVVVRQANAGAGGTLDRDPRRQQQPLSTPVRAIEASSPEPPATALQAAAWEPEGILDVHI